MPARPAPQQRVQPCGDLLERERLDDVVVGAALQAAHAVVDLVARRQHAHGHRVAALAQPPQHLGAVEVGHARSSRIAAGRTRSAASSAARPPEAPTMRKPSSSRPAVTVRRIAASSSTSRTSGAPSSSATLDDLAVAADLVARVGDHPVAPGPHEIRSRTPSRARMTSLPAPPMRMSAPARPVETVVARRRRAACRRRGRRTAGPGPRRRTGRPCRRGRRACRPRRGRGSGRPPCCPRAGRRRRCRRGRPRARPRARRRRGRRRGGGRRDDASPAGWRTRARARGALTESSWCVRGP